jgi:hypothetical protein
LEESLGEIGKVKPAIFIDDECKCVRMVQPTTTKMTIQEVHSFLEDLCTVLYRFHKRFPEVELGQEIKNSCFDPSTPNYVDRARDYHRNY